MTDKNLGDMLKKDIKVKGDGKMVLEGVKDTVQIGKVNPKDVELTEEKLREELKPLLKKIIKILRKYMDLEEDYYLLIAV